MARPSISLFSSIIPEKIHANAGSSNEKRVFPCMNSMTREIMRYDYVGSFSLTCLAEISERGVTVSIVALRL
jgi:hypothetical protein